MSLKSLDGLFDLQIDTLGPELPQGEGELMEPRLRFWWESLKNPRARGSRRQGSSLPFELIKECQWDSGMIMVTLAPWPGLR
jgi:hypothetical protein